MTFVPTGFGQPKKNKRKNAEVCVNRQTNKQRDSYLLQPYLVFSRTNASKKDDLSHSEGRDETYPDLR